MPPVVPSILIPYFSVPPPGSLTLITSVLDASATWLTLRYIYAALAGTDEYNDLHSPEFKREDKKIEARDHRVVFLSLLRPLNLWSELGKKVGLDLQKLIATKRLAYVDGLGYHDPSRDTVTDALRADFSSSQAEEIELIVRRATNYIPPGGLTLIIDGIDFLLASNPNVTGLKLSQVLLSLRKDFNQVVLACSSDAPLVHNATATATPLEREHLAFMTAVAHQSHSMMQLRSLDTGAAKDVSGVLRISQGGGVGILEEDVGIPDGEWLYQVKGDGSVKVWSRGE